MSSTTSALSALERAPYDIHFAIFRYACTDGGRAGATLARTSRTVAAAVAPFRFHSLRLSSLRQIRQLLLCHERIMRAHHVSSLVKGENKNTTRGHFPGLHQAQHLLLSFLPGPGCDAPPSQRRGVDAESASRDHWMITPAEEEAREIVKASWEHQFVEFFVSQLFSLVAPTLRSLVILQSADLPLPYVGGVQFPMLRELALFGDDRMFNVWAEPDRSQEPSGLIRDEILYDVFDEAPWASDEVLRFIDGPPHRSLSKRSSSSSSSSRRPGSRAADALGDFTVPFPALTHFHIVDEGMLKERLWESTLQLWTRLAPAVTHLRVSQASEPVLEMLTASSSRHPRPNFQKLERTIVQPFVLEPELDHEVVEEDHVLSRTRGARRGATIVLMRGRWFRQGYWQDRLRGAWEERMSGRLGCWAEREEDEGGWAYLRRKRAEVAAAKTQRVLAGRPMAERAVSMIRLDQDERLAQRLWRRYFLQALAEIA